MQRPVMCSRVAYPASSGGIPN